MKTLNMITGVEIKITKQLKMIMTRHQLLVHGKETLKEQIPIPESMILTTVTGMKMTNGVLSMEEEKEDMVVIELSMHKYYPFRINK